jgi:hypothetical protein
MIACGPDNSTSEERGFARGIIAIGDIAVGMIAIGGIATGVVSIGGLSLGLVSIGGVAAGGLVLGGVSLGLVAFGGVAVGLAAGGGVAIGYYAAGGRTIGVHLLNATQRSPEAVDFFRYFLPWISRWTFFEQVRGLSGVDASHHSPVKVVKSAVVFEALKI